MDDGLIELMKNQEILERYRHVMALLRFIREVKTQRSRETTTEPETSGKEYRRTSRI